MKRFPQRWMTRAVLSVSVVALGLLQKAINISDLQRKPGS